MSLISTNTKVSIGGSQYGTIAFNYLVLFLKAIIKKSRLRYMSDGFKRESQCFANDMISMLDPSVTS